MDAISQACTAAAQNSSALTYFFVFGLIVILVVMLMNSARQREESDRLNERVRALQAQNEGLLRSVARSANAPAAPAASPVRMHTNGAMPGA